MALVNTLADVAVRAEMALAISAEFRPVKYALGAGGFNPSAKAPWSASATMDCSGFAAWCIGVSRHYQAMPNGDWIETSQIHADAKSCRVVFRELEEPVIGALLVWPDQVIESKLRHGHVGVIAETKADTSEGVRVSKVIHCSAGNWRATGNAIGATGADVFDRNGAIIVAPVWMVA